MHVRFSNSCKIAWCQEIKCTSYVTRQHHQRNGRRPLSCLLDQTRYACDALLILIALLTAEKVRNLPPGTARSCDGFLDQSDETNHVPFGRHVNYVPFVSHSNMRNIPATATLKPPATGPLWSQDLPSSATSDQPLQKRCWL